MWYIFDNLHESYFPVITNLNLKIIYLKDNWALAPSRCATTEKKIACNFTKNTNSN